MVHYFLRTRVPILEGVKSWYIELPGIVSCVIRSTFRSLGGRERTGRSRIWREMVWLDRHWLLIRGRACDFGFRHDGIVSGFLRGRHVRASSPAPESGTTRVSPRPTLGKFAANRVDRVVGNLSGVSCDGEKLLQMLG